MKSIVSTFGGAVTYLSDKFGTFDISSKRTEIMIYIGNNPDDKATMIAWKSFLKGTQQTNDRGLQERKYDLWTATDVETGTEYKATSASKLGALIGVTGVAVNRASVREWLVGKRYKITRERVKVGVNTGARRYIWVAEDPKNHEVIEAASARELGILLGGMTDSAIIWALKNNKLANKRYKITRKIAQ